MPSIAPSARERKLVVGVDTHRDSHTAVAIDDVGVQVAVIQVPADRAGYRSLVGWVRTLGVPQVFGVEGTGSYGAGLCRYLQAAGYLVVEVTRPRRVTTRGAGKSDPIDAEAAARAVLAGTATITPKTGDGIAEMLRQIKVARDTAVRARTQAINALKALVLTCPQPLAGDLAGLPTTQLIQRCTRLRAGQLHTPTDAARHSLRALARRYRALTDEINQHTALIDTLTTTAAPTLRAGIGIGPDSAAEILGVYGDNPHRIHSEAALARICGAAPIPASSGNTHRHRLDRSGNRRANAALHRIIITRLRHHQPTIDYPTKRTQQGMTRREAIRCLKRFLTREIHHRVMADHPLVDT